MGEIHVTACNLVPLSHLLNITWFFFPRILFSKLFFDKLAVVSLSLWSLTPSAHWLALWICPKKRWHPPLFSASTCNYNQPEYLNMGKGTSGPPICMRGCLGKQTQKKRDYSGLTKCRTLSSYKRNLAHFPISADLLAFLKNTMDQVPFSGWKDREKCSNYAGCETLNGVRSDCFLSCVWNVTHFPSRFCFSSQPSPANMVGPISSEVGQFMALHQFCAELCDFRWFWHETRWRICSVPKLSVQFRGGTHVELKLEQMVL